MLRHFLIAGLFTGLACAPGLADTPLQDDGLVRLPGQGELKLPLLHHGEMSQKARADRLVPGGGLLLSFDTNADGEVSPAELAAGAATAFRTADANEDGTLTALEQQDWAAQLPTRDDTLANPVRFDPNLDRRVSEAEFTGVIRQIAAPYVDAATGNVPLSALDAPPERVREVRLERRDPRSIERNGRAGP